MVDASGIGGSSKISNLMTNVPKNQFITAADAWVGIRKDTLDKGIKIFFRALLLIESNKHS